MIAFLGIISFLVFIIYLIMSVVSLIGKKGTFKRNALIAGVSFVLVIILMAIDPNEKDTDTAENTETEDVEIEQNENEEKEVETEVPDEPGQNEVEENGQENEDENIEETENDEVNNEESSSWDDLKDKDNIIGQSDKSYKGISKSKPSDVRNDKTGKWKKITTSKSIDVLEHALDYSDKYMSEGDVHYIIDFNKRTTSQLNLLDGILYITVYEYVDKEEHDAGTIGSGMMLKNYWIYPDGDIEVVN